MCKIKVKYAGLCGSDIGHVLTNTLEIPLKNMGHEIVGIVTEDKENKIKKGEWVLINPFIASDKKNDESENYAFDSNFKSLGKELNGGFSGEVEVPLINLYPIPDNICNKSVGILADGLAVVFHAISVCEEDIRKNKDILIIGSGTIACLLAMVLDTMGKKVAVKVRDTKKGHKVAEIFKNNRINIITEIKKEESLYGLIFETVGGEQVTSLNEAIDISKKKGKICVIGAFYNNSNILDIRTMFKNELMIKGINSYGTYDFRKAVEWLFLYSDRVVELITYYEKSNIDTVQKKIQKGLYSSEIKVAILL